jgi:hypothetical protein
MRKEDKEWTKGINVHQERSEISVKEGKERNTPRIKEKKHIVKERNG